MKQKLLKPFTFALFLALVTNISAQTFQTAKNSIAPSQEEFKPAFGQIRDSVGLGKRIGDDQKETDTYRIYNEDGSLWYEFSSYKSSPLYLKSNPNKDFKPIRIKLVRHGADLELIGESKNWYKVIINDETRDYKYVWKNDPMFGFSSWESLISSALLVKFDKEKNLLLDSPNGKPKNIQIPAEIEFFFIYKLFGDWLLVHQNLKSGEQISGWIKWKENNTLLIRFWEGEKLTGS
jgi:hypothetical protein